MDIAQRIDFSHESYTMNGRQHAKPQPPAKTEEARDWSLLILPILQAIFAGIMVFGYLFRG